MSEGPLATTPGTELYARFLKEFRQVARSVRRTRVATSLGLGAALVAIVIVVLATGDYFLELPRGGRQGLLLVGAVGLMAWLFTRRRDQRWAAVERGTVDDLERVFPELGQRVRTAVQFGTLKGEAVSSRGVAPNLLEAMRAELDRQSSPLDLSRIVSTRTTAGAILLGLLLVGGVWLSTFTAWDWNAAVTRALGGTARYMAVSIHTADAVVEERANFRLGFAVTGRCPPSVFVQTRPFDRTDAEWREREVRADAGRLVAAANRWSPPSREFDVSMGTVTEPLAWRIIVGGETSRTYRLGVRYPLAIRRIQVEVTPPGYTRLPVRNFDDGSVTALVGSQARFMVELDNAPQRATLHAEPVVPHGADAPAWISPEVVIQGTTVTFETQLTESFDWWLEADGTENVKLPRRDFRVRTQSDDPPKIVFEFPGERYDVHPLAEIPLKLKVTDDYGLARSGLVFQINNDEEHTLLEQEFPVEPAGADGTLALPRTRAILEQLLPLEELALTQRDCIAYYAWAEDNRPGDPQRTETEVRYIDLRPFRQVFVLPPEQMAGGGGGDMNFTFGRRLTLDEILERQRTILNRTLGLTKRVETTDRELNTIDRLTVAQNRLASATRELAAFFTAEEFDGADMLFQAEASMLSAIDSISVASYDRAVLQERDAQQFLVEARNRIRVALQDPRNSSRLPRIRRFERQLSQKLRRPRRDNQQQETVQTLIAALRKLADDQRMSARQLAAMSEPPHADKPEGNTGADQPPTEPTNEPTGTPPATTASTEPAPTETEPATPPPAATPPGDGTPPDSAPTGEAEVPPAPPKKSLAQQREELIDRLADTLADTKQIETSIEREPTMTALTKTRIKAAVARMEEASKTLESAVKPETVAPMAEESAEMLTELAVQIAALSKEELAEQLASARDLASYLADEQRDGMAKWSGEKTDSKAAAGSRGEPDTEARLGVVRTARQLTEQSKTFEDVLSNLAKSDTPEGGETIDKVAELLKSPEMAGLVRRFEEQQRTLEGSVAGAEPRERSPEETRKQLELAETTERAAMTLERLYRAVVMPRIELLRTIQATAIRLENVTNPNGANSNGATAAAKEEAAAAEPGSGWNREVDELLEQAEAMGVGGEAVAVARGGGGGGRTEERSRDSNGQRSMSDRSLTVATSRGRALRVLIEELDRRIQETILADVEQMGTEASPPRYEPHVEEYLKVLARDRGGMRREK